jgi:hypothetical protein
MLGTENATSRREQITSCGDRANLSGKADASGADRATRGEDVAQ